MVVVTYNLRYQVQAVKLHMMTWYFGKVVKLKAEHNLTDTEKYNF